MNSILLAISMNFLHSSGDVLPLVAPASCWSREAESCVWESGVFDMMESFGDIMEPALVNLNNVRVVRGDNVALEVPLQAADDVGTGTMSQRAMDGATELMIGLFRAGVGKL